MVKRFEKLNSLPADHKAPESVQRYISEASRLYIEGHFDACLILCRATLEFALRDRLLHYSRGNDNAESLEKMIELGERVFALAHESSNGRRRSYSQDRK